MTRVVIVGTSHVIALIEAAEQLDLAGRGFDIDFFTLPSTLHSNLKRNGDQLTLKPDTPQHVKNISKRMNGSDGIVFGNPDHVIFYGHAIGDGHILKITDAFRVDGIVDPRDDETPLLSASAFEAILDHTTQFRRPAPEWMNWELDCTLSFLAPPRLSEAVLTSTDEKYAPWRRFADIAPVCDRALRMLLEQTRKALAAEGIWQLDHPDTLLTKDGLVRREYITEQTKPQDDGKPRPDDYHHVNADYGALLLEHLLQTLPEVRAEIPAARVRA